LGFARKTIDRQQLDNPSRDSTVDFIVFMAGRPRRDRSGSLVGGRRS
jgi:hypothetical protein